MTRSKMKLAIVGAGYYSQYHIEAWQRLDAVEIVGMTALDREHALHQAKRFNVGPVYDDLSEMLRSARPDIVDIITPPASHREIVSEVLASNADVICQKPFANDAIEAAQLVELAEKSGRQLIVHEDWRFAPWFRETKNLLDQGAIGDLYSIMFRIRPGDGQGPRAYLDRQPFFRKMPRLLIRETGIHIIDTFRYLFGEISAVTARLRRINPVLAGEDAGIVMFEFRNGAAGLLDGNRCADHDADDPRLTLGEMLVEGSRGAIRLDGRGRIWIRQRGSEEAQHRYEWTAHGAGGDNVFRFQQHVVSHLTSGATLETAARDYLTNIKIEEAIYRSHETGELQVM